MGLDTLQLSVIDNYICVMIFLRLTRDGYIWPLCEFCFSLDPSNSGKTILCSFRSTLTAMQL